MAGVDTGGGRVAKSRRTSELSVERLELGNVPGMCWWVRHCCRQTAGCSSGIDWWGEATVGT